MKKILHIETEILNGYYSESQLRIEDRRFREAEERRFREAEERRFREA
jgi:hypothetical protein